MEKEPITTQGLKKLQEELEDLKNNKRPKVVAAIAEARAHGDLKENAEYHAAKEQQGHIEGRVLEIGNVIATANVIEHLGGKVIFADIDLKTFNINPEKLKELGSLNEPERLQYEGGFGIPLMRVLADEIQIDSADEGTTVQLVVYIPPSS